MSEIMNGYRLNGSFQNNNAGFSRWTTAVKHGYTYFLKEFINPIYPEEGTLSEKLRQDRIDLCKDFEREKIRLYRDLNVASDGNLVRIQEFFRHNSHYYISMDYIENDNISFEDLQKYSLRDRLMLCRSVAHSIMRLHSKKIIHSDIKATNVIIKRSPAGKPIGKVIDFDSAFFEYNKPQYEDELGGDQVYLSPEGCMFIRGREVEITDKIDVFAMGILFHQYLTGDLPGYDREEYRYCHQVVLDDEKLILSPALSEEVKSLLSDMLECDAGKRINSAEVFHRLGKILFKDDETTLEKKKPEDFFNSGGDLK